MWEFFRKANGRCGNCGAKTLKVDTSTRTLICQSCGAINKSSWIVFLIIMFTFFTIDDFFIDNISSPYNWLVIIFILYPLALFILSLFRQRVISISDEQK